MTQASKDGVHYTGDKREISVTVEPVFDKYGNFEIERVWEVLGDHDIIQIDEINPGAFYSYALDMGEYVYFITPENWNELRTIGQTTLEYQGPLKDFIDTSSRSHVALS